MDDRHDLLDRARRPLHGPAGLDTKLSLVGDIQTAATEFAAARRRLATAFDTAIEGGWSPSALGALGLRRPARQSSGTSRHGRRRATTLVTRNPDLNPPREGPIGGN